MARARKRSLWVTPAEYADHRKVSRQAVHKAIRDGRITLVSGRIDPNVADREWVENSGPEAGDLQPEAGTGEDGAPGSALAFRRGRALWQNYRALREKLAYENEKGRLGSLEEFKAAGHLVAMRVGAALDAFPARVAPEVAAARTRAECERILIAEVRRLREDLARGAAADERKPA